MTRERALAIAKVARRQAVTSARIEGMIVPDESRHTEEEIFRICESTPGFKGWAEDDE